MPRVHTYAVATILSAIALLLTIALVIEPSNATWSSTLVSILGLLGIIFAADQGPVAHKNTGAAKALETANILHSLALSHSDSSPTSDSS